MWGLRPGITALMALALPLLCHADITLTFLDSTENVMVSLNGLTSNCAENCSVIVQFPGFTNPSTFALLFNIYDPGGVTLSDTLQITGTAGTNEIDTNFQSDIEGVPLFPLAGGTMITETGAVLTAARNLCSF